MTEGDALVVSGGIVEEPYSFPMDASQEEPKAAGEQA
jgi:hypothetical protein